MKETVEEQQDFVKDIHKMSEDFDRWYTDVVRKAEMADWSGVRGMMVVRPYGWAMWDAYMGAPWTRDGTARRGSTTPATR